MKITKKALNYFNEKYKIRSYTDDELKNIAKDLYNGKILTSLQVPDDLVNIIFMPIMFMGPKEPEYPKSKNSINDPIAKEIDNVLFDLLDKDDAIKKYNKEISLFKKELEYYKTIYIKNIGIVFEYFSNSSGSVAINNYPIFYSCHFLSVNDKDNMLKFYEQYKVLRESIDNF